IALPKEKVVELWENPDNLVHWQDGFMGMDHISGNPGQAGAKSLMKYQFKRGLMELEETILENQLPDRFAGQYDHKHMTNTMVNTFTELPNGDTRWSSEIEYTKFKAFLPRLMAFLFPGMFRKQAQKWFDQFKTFSESQS
ncbi:MAG: SRPBCC family protein, partial [Saprospiraceae bacterium]|nr:SRPBCC family protein [Saprospiraceae bacterium]